MPVVDLAASAAAVPRAAAVPSDPDLTVPSQEGELSFEQLQAQLRQFKDTPQPDATVSGDPEDRTRKDPSAPKHRGVLETDYEGPSYSELKRRASAGGSDENRLSLPVGYMLLEYRIERVLGIGGFGVSYLAHGPDHRVAQHRPLGRIDARIPRLHDGDDPGRVDPE